MSRCHKARALFGAYWDDETSRAEREWLDAHFSECAPCRTEYESLARTLTAVAALPRMDAAPDLAERALAAARRSPAVPDVVFVRPATPWVPMAAAAAVLLVAGVMLAPVVMHPRTGTTFAHNDDARPVAEPRLVAVATPSSSAPGGTPAATAPGHVSVTISDTLFDHSEDVDFVLDPVTLRRGHAHTVSRLPHGIQGEQAVITF